jgi:hypothetical protein
LRSRLPLQAATLRCGVRWLAAVAVVVGLWTLGGLGLLVELAADLPAVECCGDRPCDAPGDGPCERGCAHCSCAHPSALPLLAIEVPDPVPTHQAAVGWHLDQAHRAGYRSLPFRPPTA